MSNDVTIIGEPKQTEIGGKRFYRVDFSDGTFRHLRSVTSVCKGARLPSFLDDWQEQQIEALGRLGFRDAMNQKAHDGTLVHKFIEMHLLGEDVNRTSVAEIQTRINGTEALAKFQFDDDTWPMYEAYLRWEEKRKPKFHWMEKTLFSLRHGYAGRSDGKCEINGRLPIIDFKTAKKVYDDHKQQGSSYLFAENERGGDADSVLILALGAENKQGYTETWLTEPYEIHQHFMGFYHKLQLINWAHPL